jgi:lipopolysaccharide/colanic/teichoic acid biosynthesis glycosyltransferase/UDP-N-acetyl-D-mannosaminuronic acid transferase (WecB/TagA/CpsF family)
LIQKCKEVTLMEAIMNPTSNTQSSLSKINGIEIARLNLSEAQQYFSFSLNSRSKQAMLFCDAALVRESNKNDKLLNCIKSCDLILPRGKGVNFTLNLKSTDKETIATTDEIYRELFLELESSQAKTLIITDSKAINTRLTSSIATLSPNLDYEILESESVYDQSTTRLIERISMFEYQAVVLVMKSPVQELTLDALRKSHKIHGLLVSAGLPLIDMLDQTKSNNIWSKVKRSSLLRPAILVDFIKTTLSKGDTNKRTTNANVFVTSSGLSIRLSRLQIRMKSSLWNLRCKMQTIMKRTIDISGAGGGLLALSPLLLCVMAIIKVTSPGPIFYSQIRVGYRGERFRMWKFRSMYTDADARKAALEAENEMAGGVIFKMKNDPRITPIGRIIRRLSIDELPQLWNVVMGDMSLVGPRPALENEVAQYPALARARLEAMPGLTGLWQISGRSDLPFDKQVLLDTAYVNTQSPMNDIKLIAKTIPAVVSGKGAY